MLTIKIEQNGKTRTYQVGSNATLSIKGDAQLNDNGIMISAASELTVEGLVPWAGIRMTVNIAEVNIRHAPNTEQAKFTSIKKGTALTVSAETTESIGFLWRTIIEPPELSGKWVAQQKIGVDEIYIVAVEGESTVVDSGTGSPASAVVDNASPVTATVVDTGSTVTENVPDTPTNEPAALTGRFQLVKKNGPGGAYTALAIDGDSTARLGVNVREFPHFGIPQWKWTDPNTRADYCRTAQEIGMKWLRFFTPHVTYNTLQENLDRIGQTLDVIAAHDMVAIVTLTDSLADVGMFPKEDAEWHHKGTPMGHYHKDYFNTNSFRNHYHPYVKEVVSAFKGHKGVGIWMLMNEPALYMPPASDTDVEGFARWIDETSSMIYDMDKVHPMAVGMINVSHIKPPQHERQQFATDFYSKRKHIHVVTCHSYQSTGNGDPNVVWDLEDDSQADINAAAQTGRAMMWSEFGASMAGNRTQATEGFLNRQMLQNRASAALQWGYMITSNDTGVGDGNFGWSPANINREYQEMKNLFASYPGKLAGL